ncbi:MAG: penicillin-binding transpeptidase domain-containing protein [Corynebacterium sp.]|uniref:penicillin-binding transpeptidase domain-containing protein n=1 Tax=Corynebacterium sp. TaxID=1720 RepID=UPI0026DA9DB5|nr:penicillin-binding transpeptidase domain-containing protein [Corynebacterium sp.]MDO5030269.1 penicillin-binding transpeptidase domain-containing protein [Corynebacterium sp.]
MNKTIRQIFVVVLGLFALLLANLTFIQGFQEDKYANNPLNSRQFLEEKSKPRGQITTDGAILAHSVKNDNDLYDRSYDTDPEAYAPVVGYLSDIYGSAGIERSQNDILNGSDPSLLTSRAIDTLTGKKPSGASTELTLIPNAQLTAYRQLAERGYVGSAVAVRPSTGEILAMASTPSFNPNDVVAGDEAAWQNLSTNEDAPLLNHATQRPLPPGSTFKVLTTVAALENGATPETSVTGAPQITLPDTTTTLENYGGSTCGGATTTLRNAFARSCNTAFAELGMQNGADALKDVAKRFGIGDAHEDSGVPVEPSTVGEIPDQSALGQSSIGQRDVSFTPLDNAMIAATIANGGVRMEPQIIKSVRKADLSEIKSFKPIKAEEAVTPEIAQTVTELMRASESHSGGNGSRIASKTGTAEHGAVRGEYAPHVWYIAFAPDADVAVAVVVENGGGQGQGATGASVAAPIGRAVIDAVEQAGR